MISKQDGLVTTTLTDNGFISVKVEAPDRPTRAWSWTRQEVVHWLNINGHLLNNNTNWVAIVGPYPIQSHDVKSIIRTVRYVITKTRPNLSLIDQEVITELRTIMSKALSKTVRDKYGFKRMIDQYFAIEDMGDAIYGDYLDRMGMTESGVLFELIKLGKITVRQVFEDPSSVNVALQKHFSYDLVKNFEYFIIVPHLESLGMEYIEPGTDVHAVN